MTNYDDFVLIISAILPLPQKNTFVSADGTSPVDLKKASKKIQHAIKKYAYQHDLKPAGVTDLKQLAIQRFDTYREAWSYVDSEN